MFFLACLMLLATSVTAQASIPQGIWVVTQVTIERNTDGDIETAVYNSVAEVQSFIPSFKELEIINAQSVKVRYDSWKEKAQYTIDGNQLIVLTSVAKQTYEYSMKGENLVLTAVYSYLYNLPTGQTQQITENWTIVLKKLSE